MSLPPAWKISHSHIVRHDEVGGVTNGKFEVEVRSLVGIELSHRPVSHVAGALGEALDELTPGCRVDLPIAGALNSFRGVLSWAQRKKGCVIAKCVFHPGGAVRRKVSNQEMFAYSTILRIALAK